MTPNYGFGAYVKARRLRWLENIVWCRWISIQSRDCELIWMNWRNFLHVIRLVSRTSFISKIGVECSERKMSNLIMSAEACATSLKSQIVVPTFLFSKSQRTPDTAMRATFNWKLGSQFNCYCNKWVLEYAQSCLLKCNTREDMLWLTQSQGARESFFECFRNHSNNGWSKKKSRTTDILFVLLTSRRKIIGKSNDQVNGRYRGASLVHMSSLENTVTLWNVDASMSAPCRIGDSWMLT